MTAVRGGAILRGVVGLRGAARRNGWRGGAGEDAAARWFMDRARQGCVDRKPLQFQCFSAHFSTRSVVLECESRERAKTRKHLGEVCVR
jgi:hypothetical protein